MLCRSTRGRAPALPLSRAILRGLAPDGGLYVPEHFPRFAAEDFADAATLPEIAARLLAPFVAGDPLEPHLVGICARAFSFPVPLRDLGGETWLLELFHGPTAAFKDVGARFLAAALGCLEAAPRTVLAATSGDTGSAIAAAFHAREGVEVVVVFPAGGVSPRQRHQLGCWGGNVRTFAVAGTFDDCQRLVKEAFADEAWRQRRGLTSANSINLGRLLPQAAYHAAAALEVRRQTGISPTLIVPSGNLGNACAALWARAMGLPISRVVLAANANRPVPDFFATGRFTPRPAVPTLANAMDVGDPSNMERLLDLFPSREELGAAAAAASADDGALRRALLAADERWGTVLCPHTAAAADYRLRHPEGPAVIAATAHPAKFEAVIEPLLGREIPLPPNLAALLLRPAAWEELPADLSALQAALDGS